MTARLWALGLLGGCSATSSTPPAPAPKPLPTLQVVVAPDEPPKVAGRGRDPDAEERRQAAIAAGDCDPMAGQRARREGDLTVPSPPTPPATPFFGRLRNHTSGSLTRGSARVWIGPPVPITIPLHQASAELTLLDPMGDGFLAVYRDPYNSGSCDLGGANNCRMVAVGFDRCGKAKWTQALNNAMSRTDHLEVQDVRWADGTLYFNEACQSYAREAGGACSALIALNPETGEVKWRTPHLTSNNRFVIAGEYIVAGYGFTAEADTLALVRRKDGKVVHKQPLPSAHEDITREEDGSFAVRIYPGDRVLHFSLQGADSDKARLVSKR